MPWEVMDVVDERTRFVVEYDSGSFTMAELCRIYGIARKTGYLWVGRYEAEGLAGLQDRRYGAGHHPNQTDGEMEKQIVQLKQVHPSWGAKKLRAYLLAKKKGVKWPVVSTFGEILRREGLSTPQRKRLRTPLYTKPFEKVERANQIWCADFKGWFRTGTGERIDPLTITDAHSRYLLRCQSVEKTNTEQVQAIFAAAFREYGMPQTIRTDNGAPFASRAIAGISRLSIYWMKLGIQPERIKPGHPEQNGRHERMHRTLKAETAKPPAVNRRAQQRAFDRFRQQFNQERPHEALEQKTRPAATRVRRASIRIAFRNRNTIATSSPSGFTRMELSSGRAHRSLSASVWAENPSVWSRSTIATGTFILPPSHWRDSIVINSSCNRFRLSRSEWLWK
jgi:transposase InsO family protein